MCRRLVRLQLGGIVLLEMITSLLVLLLECVDIHEGSTNHSDVVADPLRKGRFRKDAGGGKDHAARLNQFRDKKPYKITVGGSGSESSTQSKPTLFCTIKIFCDRARKLFAGQANNATTAGR